MFGAPPNCRPECVINQDCPSNRACIRQRCEDPCIGICGFNAQCSTQNHQPTCSCIESFEGDPYTACRMRESEYISFDYLLSSPGARTLCSLMLNVPFSGVSRSTGLVVYTSYACSSYCVHIISHLYIPIYILYILALSLSRLYIPLYASCLLFSWFYHSCGARSTLRPMLSIALWRECHLSRAQRSRLLQLRPELFR